MKYKELRRLWKEKMIIVCKSSAWRLYVLIWRVKNRDLHVASQRSYHVKYSWDFDTFTNVVKIFFQIWLKRNSMKNCTINKQKNRWTCSFGLSGLRCPKGLRLICRLSKCMLILFNQLIKVSSCYVGQNDGVSSRLHQASYLWKRIRKKAVQFVRGTVPYCTPPGSFIMVPHPTKTDSKPLSQ